VGTRYRPYWKVIRCADYGVPQLRERVFIVGARDGREFSFSPRPHTVLDVDSDDLFGAKLEPHRTAWDALGDLGEPNDPSLERWRTLGRAFSADHPGRKQLLVAHQSRRRAPRCLAGARAYWSFLLKAIEEAPIMDDTSAAGIGYWAIPLE